MAKKMMSMWKPPPQIKLPEKETKKKSKFYFPSPDKEVDDVFIAKSPTFKFSTNSPEFESAREKFFKKYKIPDEGKRDFVEMFMKREPEAKPKQAKSKRPLHSASSVGLTSSSRYKETRMSLPSLSTRAPPSPIRQKISRKVSEGSIERFGTRVSSCDDIRRAVTNISESPDERFETCAYGGSLLGSLSADDATAVDDGKCIFHHRCRSTSLDQPMNQFQISIGGSSTIIIADYNTIILHGQNAQLVSQHEKIALKLLFNMTDDIITRMVNANFLEDLGEIMLKKGATPLEIGRGCVEIWLSFAETDKLTGFTDELTNGKLRDELAQLLLRHGYMKDDNELTISIKEKKVENGTRELKLNGETAVFSKFEGATEPINFMMSAYGCTDPEQLDTILSGKYNKRVPLGGFTEHFSTSDSITESQKDIPELPGLNTFPTLLHFAAFHGLSKLCGCLLATPGFSQAVCMKNKDGLNAIEIVPDDKPNIREMLDKADK